MNNKGKAHQALAFLLFAILAGSLFTACQSSPTQVPATPIVEPTSLKTDEILVAVDSGNAPFMYEKDNQAAGLYPLLIQGAFKRMGIAMTVRPYPWKRALDMGSKGQAGVGGIYKTEQRLQVYDYSAPLFSEKLLLFVKKGNGFTFNNIDDLKGKTLGVLAGWSYGDAFDQAKAQGLFKTEEVPNDLANFDKLLLGRLDCIVAIELTAQQIIAEKQYADQVEALTTPLATNDTYLVFAKSAHQTALLDKFNAALTAMRQDGTYDLLVNSQK